MSKQINDSFLYNGNRYSISAIQHPHDFFSIQQLGINPLPENTACWRGYIAVFTLNQNNLVLQDLDTNNSNGKATPVEINGIVPVVEKPEGLVEGYREWRKWKYRNINLTLPYSGCLLITDDFIQERYIHMGFQSPLSYRKVIELKFGNGKLIEESDLSEIVEQKRKTQHVETREEQIARLPIWIDECFNLSYKIKFDFD